MITYYQANLLLNKIFGGNDFTWSPPAVYHIGLSRTTINADGTGATEPSGMGYARVAVTNNKTNFGAASAGALTNLTAITFPESSGDWGTITHIFIADNSTGGNILYFDQLAQSRIVQSGTIVMFSGSPNPSLTLSMPNT